MLALKVVATFLLLALVVAAVPAEPATIHYDQPTRTLQFVADPGEADQVTVTTPAGGQLRVVVGNGDTILLTGDVTAGFTLSPDATQLDIDNLVAPIERLGVDLKDYDDQISLTLNDITVTGIGGGGYDVVSLVGGRVVFTMAGFVTGQLVAEEVILNGSVVEVVVIAPSCPGNVFDLAFTTGAFTPVLPALPDGMALNLAAVDGVLRLSVSGTPFANAGPDQTADEGSLVTLTGSSSTGGCLTFAWTQLAGPAVALSDQASALPSFDAPLLAGGIGGNQTLTFRLTVSNAVGSSTDTVDVTVRNLNHAPVADAGTEKTVNEGSSVTLDASKSYDPESDPVSYQWVQTDGPVVTLTGATTAQAGFTAPLLPGGLGGPTLLTFELTVSDGALSGTDQVQVTVEQVNHSPTADAGVDQTKNGGTLVTLDGTGSDPDGDPLTYAWSQVSGSAVTLSDATSPTPSFTAPPGGGTLVFALVVSDGTQHSAPDEVQVTVTVNDPPACGLARPSRALLWPPNHKLVPIQILGVTDPDNGDVAITITGVTQDEPVDGTGDGDTSPDAVLQGSTVLLRAERVGDGNGRVYEVSFMASDGQGGDCTGSVRVGVPLNLKPGTVVIDDGQLYDATQP